MRIGFNKKGLFNYYIIDKYQAGITLEGLEVKSLKTKKGVSMTGSYIVIVDNVPYLRGVTIAPYQPNNTPEEYKSNRERKLLLTKKEITELNRSLSEKGLTVIPISIHNKGGRIVVEIALVRGKRKHDKRETIKKRESQRDMRRLIKNVR